MRIAELYSHLNGHEHILCHRPHMWRELEACIGAVEGADRLTKPQAAQTTSRATMPAYSAPALARAFSAELQSRGWQSARISHWTTSDPKAILRGVELPAAEQKAEIEEAGLAPIQSYNQTDFVKDRIAVEVQLGKYSFIAYDLFVKHMAFFVGDMIDVGIEILAMKELQAQMSSGVGYYEGALYDLIRQGRGVPAVPLVLVGIAP